jgi:NAD(P)-dependent dehydrogenase (short-subunit alcohol dehydrogenase family)
MAGSREAGRVVLLTGAAGGIGAAMTAALIEDGHAIAAVDRDGVALARLAERHEAARDRLHPILADLGEEAGCALAAEEARRRFGRIDAVVNNAGIGVSGLRPDGERNLPSIEELTAAVWDRFFAINVRAPMLLTRASVPEMKRRRWGRVVNNTTSYLTMLRVLPYGATKSALEAMSAIWAKELEGTGVTVNVLVPGGPTDTPFVSDASGIPRDKMLRPAVMGPPLRWLISDAAGGFTGKRIVAGRWDVGLPPSQAAEKVARGIGWPELTHDVIWPGGGPGG